MSIYSLLLNLMETTPSNVVIDNWVIICVMETTPLNVVIDNFFRVIICVSFIYNYIQQITNY